MGLKKMIAIDLLPSEMVARECGLPYFPIREFHEIVAGPQCDTDVMEIVSTLVRMVPRDDSPEALAEVTDNFERKRHAMQMSGATVIEAPAKRSESSPSGYKHSDDQRLVIATLSYCFRLRPDFLTFVAADGDYAPMVEELRREGIRTEVVAAPKMLASDLKKVAWSTIDLEEILKTIKERQ
jgi:hypothetical protein